jgi:hypothetical protein
MSLEVPSAVGGRETNDVVVGGNVTSNGVGGRDGSRRCCITKIDKKS